MENGGKVPLGRAPNFADRLINDNMHQTFNIRDYRSKEQCDFFNYILVDQLSPIHKEILSDIEA